MTKTGTVSWWCLKIVTWGSNPRGYGSGFSHLGRGRSNRRLISPHIQQTSVRLRFLWPSSFRLVRVKKGFMWKSLPLLPAWSHNVILSGVHLCVTLSLYSGETYTVGFGVGCKTYSGSHKTGDSSVRCPSGTSPLKILPLEVNPVMTRDRN